MVYCAKILVRYRYMLHENEANQLITCRFSKFLIQLCKKKRFLWGFVLKYYFLGGSCRNITVPRYWASEVLCRALFRGCAEILVLGRNIHLWTGPLCDYWLPPHCGPREAWWAPPCWRFWAHCSPQPPWLKDVKICLQRSITPACVVDNHHFIPLLLLGDKNQLACRVLCWTLHRSHFCAVGFLYLKRGNFM